MLSILEDMGSDEAGHMAALPPEQPLQQQQSSPAPEGGVDSGAAQQPEQQAAAAEAEASTQQAAANQAQLMQQMQATQAQAYSALVAAPLAAGGAQPIPVAARPDGSYSFGPETVAPGAVLGMPLAPGMLPPQMAAGFAGPAYTFSSAALQLPAEARPLHGMLGLSQSGSGFKLTVKLQPAVSGSC